MAEINYAELQEQINNNPTDRQCYRLGQTHKAYNWSRQYAAGKWTQRQRDLYDLGYDGEEFPTG
jgi:hypothetical protein